MTEIDGFSTFLNDAPMLLVLLINLSVLALPVLIAVAELIRLREPKPSRSVWLCTGAAVVLFLIWLTPVGWWPAPEAQQLRLFLILGLYAWVLYDWYSSVRDDGFHWIDLPVIGTVCAMLGMTIAAYFV
ncbi:hypothetical protein TG4357_03560 [Thalassovita gelatinovora]|uniref:Uncharacterized protein n=1 Tax=Thalassovita gelatinovora TaxID=53501 RepID=A0A0P1FKY0_THAGE|nr:hypothetical protein [Thalassovita gelatinovora]QIZ82349.1 hypothetical protein HFZ77_18640 [Thalassovita gelatinovora]CUH68417.1 hypothetical protein TG4357_03560 [Thalassovita gelatinovora]SEQ51560.1 hypothetical protein SAMN04488043_10621 [Thalassovita gelatinovora]